MDREEERQLEDNPQALAAYFCDLRTRESRRFMSFPRASQLYKDCMRQLVLGVKLKKEVRVKLGFSQRMIFMLGNAVHSWVQNTDDLFGNHRRGWWVCSACGKYMSWGAPPREGWKCKNCGAGYGAARYEEHSLYLRKPLMVSGHPDMFVDFNGKIRLVELKTINGKDFEKLFLPQIDHVWQALTYLWTLKHDKIIPVNIDRSKAYICYITKRSTMGQFPLKMFHINYDEDVVRVILKKLLIFKKGIQKGGKLPALHDDCARKSRGYRAEECPVRFECFQEHRKNA